MGSFRKITREERKETFLEKERPRRPESGRLVVHVLPQSCDYVPQEGRMSREAEHVGLNTPVGFCFQSGLIPIGRSVGEKAASLEYWT